MAVKFSEFTIETIPGNVSYLVGYSGSSNIRVTPGNLLSGVIPYTGASLDVNLGAFGITASQFIKSGGTSSQFLKADGSIDSNTYLTAASGYVPYTGSTSDLDLGTHSITATTIIKVGGTSIQYLMADGSVSSGPSFAGYVPYTGATGNVYLGSNTISTDGFILYGGTNEQFLKADGSVDNNMYLTQNDLPSTLILYATNVPSGINGYFKLVTTIGDPDYNTVPVNIPTGNITTTNQFIAGLITIPNLINGNPGVFNITTIGNIRKAVGSGSGESTFFYRVYKRNNLGIETLVCTSDPTLPVGNGTYAEFQATGLFNDGVFEPTDTIVVKYYANRIAGGSNPAYEFQFGGDTPVRTIVPIPTSAIPNISLYQLIDVDANTPAENDGLFYDVSVSLWKNKSISTVLGYTPVTSARTLTINGTTYDLSANRSWSVGTVTSVGASSPLSSTGGDTPTISISQVNGLVDGYLSAADYNTFSGKQNALTIGNITSTTTDIGITGGTGAIIGFGTSLTLSNTGVTAGAYGNGVTVPNITVDAKGRVTLLSTTAIPTAGVLLTGLLTAADWNTFYNKQNPITLTTTGNSGAATFVGGTLNIPQYITTTAQSFTGTKTFDDGIAIPSDMNASFGFSSQIYEDSVDGYFNIVSASSVGLSIRSTDSSIELISFGGLSINVDSQNNALGDITFNVGGSLKGIITNDGKFGINNTATGTEKLQVTGAGIFSTTLRASNIGIGAIPNLASYLNVIANTVSVAQLYLPPSTIDYTGNFSGMLWNNNSEWKFYDSTITSVNRFIKLSGNSSLVNTNSLNAVTSTGVGGNIGTLKVEAAFSRYATSISYIVSLLTIGFGWVIAVTGNISATNITLPLANSVPAGWRITVKDEGGTALTNNITILRSSTDTIDGASSLLINTNYGFKTLYSNGVSKWLTI